MAAGLTPILIAVFAGFLVTGLALPVLPLHVNDDLGFGPVVIGIVAGAQFAAAVASRILAGTIVDRRGGKTAVLIGIAAAVLSGLLYLLSQMAMGTALVSLVVLILGRAVLGGAESLIITGGIGWGLSLVDERQAGKVISWVGTAMFVALAIGGPLGSVLYAHFGFAAIGVATMVLPMLAAFPLIKMAGNKPASTARPGGWKDVAGFVLLPGFGVAFSSMGYGAVFSFSSLYLSSNRWQPVWLAFSAFSLALIVVRLVASDWSDRYGGSRVAFWSVLVQALGLVVMAIAPNVATVTAGAAISGAGYALVFPALGAEAVRDAPASSRGLAMGLYTVFVDVAMAVGGPLMGWIAGMSDLATAYLASAAIVTCSAVIGFALSRRRRAV